MSALRVIGYIAAAIFIFFGVLFIWGAFGSVSHPGWIITGIITVLIGFGLIWLLSLNQNKDQAGTEQNITYKVDLPGQTKIEQMKCRSCGGALRYTASTGGEIDLRCNDGTLVSLQTTLLSETRGYGYGRTEQGPASIAYGLSVEEAQAFLTAPSGKTLVISPQSGGFDLQ